MFKISFKGLFVSFLVFGAFVIAAFAVANLVIDSSYPPLGTGTGASADSQRFSSPSDVAIRPSDGSIFVSDSGNNRIQWYDPAVKAWYAPSGTNLFNNPTGLFFANKVLYVADTGNKRIVRWVENPPGLGGPTAHTWQTIAITGLDQVKNIVDVAANPDGTMFIVDRDGNKVYRLQIDQIETVDPVFNLVPILSCYHPSSITIDQYSNIFVAGPDRIYAQINVMGTDFKQWTGLGLNQINGIHADGTYLYVSNTGNSEVLKFDYKKNLIASGGKDVLSNARGLSAYAGKVYVADTSNNRVAVLKTQLLTIKATPRVPVTIKFPIPTPTIIKKVIKPAIPLIRR